MAAFNYTTIPGEDTIGLVDTKGSIKFFAPGTGPFPTLHMICRREPTVRMPSPSDRAQ